MNYLDLRVGTWVMWSNPRETLLVSSLDLIQSPDDEALLFPEIISSCSIHFIQIISLYHQHLSSIALIRYDQGPQKNLCKGFTARLLLPFQQLPIECEREVPTCVERSCFSAKNYYPSCISNKLCFLLVGKINHINALKLYLNTKSDESGRNTFALD